MSHCMLSTGTREDLATSLMYLIAQTPVAVADRDAIEITPINFADFGGSIAVFDLGGGAFDEGSVPA